MDKFKSWFTGRSKEKLTIISKPIFIGIKGWVLADQGYFCHWYWHAKGDGLQGIGRVPKPLGKNKTVAVVPALLNTLPKDPCDTYDVILDNLFIFIKLLIYLSQIGYGARGTIRTNTGIFKDLLEFKKSDIKDIILWGTKHWRLITNKDII